MTRRYDEHPIIASDRRWFKKRPLARHRLRRYRRGELGIANTSQVRSVEGNDSPNTVDKLQVQADVAATETKFLEGVPDDHIACTLVSRHADIPGARVRQTIALPKSMFDKRHMVDQASLDILAAKGWLPLDSFLE